MLPVALKLLFVAGTAHAAQATQAQAVDEPCADDLPHQERMQCLAAHAPVVDVDTRWLGVTWQAGQTADTEAPHMAYQWPMWSAVSGVREVSAYVALLPGVTRGLTFDGQPLAVMLDRGPVLMGAVTPRLMPGLDAR